jgi:hypothetical protein
MSCVRPRQHACTQIHTPRKCRGCGQLPVDSSWVCGSALAQILPLLALGAAVPEVAVVRHVQFYLVTRKLPPCMSDPFDLASQPAGSHDR